MKKLEFKFSLLALFLLGCFFLANANDWELVTDASTLAVGDQLIIASSGNNTTAGDIVTGNKPYLESVSAEFADDNASLTSFEDETVIFTLGGEVGAWTLTNSEGNLLGATDTKKMAWNKGTTTWKITISDEGNATIYNTTTSYGRILYNTNNPRFTSYTSSLSESMLLPQLYRLDAPSSYTFIYEGFAGNTTRCSGGKICMAGETITLASGIPVKENNVFLGWEYNGTIYQPGDLFTMPADNVTLVPQWKYPTATKETTETNNPHKIMRQGHLYIIVNGVTYDSMGRKIK